MSGPLLGAELDLRVGNGMFDDLGNVADLIDLAYLGDIQNLIVDDLSGSLEHSGESPGNVLDVDERTPRGSVRSS